MDDPSEDQKSERGIPNVWLRALRFHTYHGRRQEEGDVYLAHEAEVENIENLRFARRIQTPPILRHRR